MALARPDGRGGLQVLFGAFYRAVHVAGVYASGLLAGGALYEYRKPSMAEKKRVQSWAALCAEHAVSLKAAALAFAFLPACVSKVAVGLAELRWLRRRWLYRGSEGRCPPRCGCCR